MYWLMVNLQVLLRLPVSAKVIARGNGCFKSCFTSKFGQFSPGVFLVVWSNGGSGFSIEQGKTQSTKMFEIKLARMVDRILRIAQVLIIPWTWGIAVTFGNRFFCSGDFEWWPFPCRYPWYVSHQGCDGLYKILLDYTDWTILVFFTFKTKNVGFAY